MPITPEGENTGMNASDDQLNGSNRGSGGANNEDSAVPVFNEVGGGAGAEPRDNTRLTLNNGGYIDPAAPAGTTESNVVYEFKITANTAGASIMVDGENSYRTTNDTLYFKLSDILNTSGKTITLIKNGYTSPQRYDVQVFENPKYTGSDIAKTDIQSAYSYTSTTPYVLIVRKFENGSRKPYTNLNNLTRELSFELKRDGAIVPIEAETSDTFIVSLDGPNNSVTIIKDGSERIPLQRGVNQIIANLGSKFSIASSDVNLYRVSEINIASNKENKSVKAKDISESIGTTITLNSRYTATIKSENYTPQSLNLPGIGLTTGEVLRTYNINANSGIAVGIRKFGEVNTVNVYVNNERLPYSDLGPTSEYALLLPDRVFPSAGQYRVRMIPRNSDGDGEPIEITVNAIQDDYIGVPDLRNISYPSLLRGPDYVGTDVDFSISYTSVNTDYVKIYKKGSSSFIRGTKSGIVRLNVATILNLDGTQLKQDDDKIYIDLELEPYNTSGREVVVGKRESIQILFDKGDLEIPRPVAMNRIAEAFLTQFDDTIFEQETSKYLTHLLHFGNGDNKVITTWVGSEDSLILKLYEPLPTSIQTNQKVWISKLQSNPIVETITLSSAVEEYCPPLKGPNFSLVADNGTGYKVFDELIASGSVTSTDIVNKYLESTGIDTSKLNIQYVSGSEYVFTNFVNFGSSEERIKNFFYKVELLETYKDKYNTLTAVSFDAGALLTTEGLQLQTEDLFDINYEVQVFRGQSEALEGKKLFDTINGIIRGFDGYEKFLYTSLEDLAFPKYVYSNPITGLATYVLKSVNDTEVVAWYAHLIDVSALFDKDNLNYLANNLPEHIVEDYNNAEFITFLDMIGQHFDIIWCYINGLTKLKVLEEKQTNGFANNMVYNLLESMGWEGKRAFNSQFLWEYAFGTYQNGFQKYGMPLEEANNQVWRRILNNLPYLLKHKGTGRAMKAVMSCYGVPQSMLSIFEFGGPQDPTKEGSTKFTFDDRTAAIHLEENSTIIVPWSNVPYTATKPESIEVRIRPDVVKDATIISGSDFKLDIIQTTGSFAKLQLNLGNNISAPYFATSGVGTPYITSSISYVLGPDTVTSSLDFPLSTEYYSNILINKYSLGGDAGLYEILLKTSDGSRIVTSVSMSLLTSVSPWLSGSDLKIGNNFTGDLDEFRLWSVPLQPSKFENHTLHPDAINGNSYTASTANLMFRLDFEYPKNRILDPYIKNVALNTTYDGVGSYATASGMYSASSYPYQYTPYDRTVTATVPSLGFNYSNKIRFEEQEMIGDLSYKARATKKSFDRAPIDSNRLGIFLSPIKELNMDIVKAFGDFNIDNYIGDPSDDYKENYTELANLRTYYFQRLNRNIYEYIQLVRYIDKSLFDVLGDLAPARARVSKGLLIEPHYLERSKTRWNKPESEKNDYDSIIDINDNNKVESTYDVKDALLLAIKDVLLDVNLPNYDADIVTADTYILEGTNPSYDSEINTTETYILTPTYPTYPQTGSINIDCNLGANITAEVDAFSSQLIGFDPNSIANAGFGLYAKRGVGMVRTFNGLYDRNELTGSRKNIYLVKEQYKTVISTQVAGYPTNGAMPGEQVLYADIDKINYRYKVTTLPFSGSVKIGNDIVGVTALDGYFPTHYKFVNNLSEGLQRSYWKGSTQTSGSTPDGLDPVEIFTTNPNILRVAKTGRGSGEPILIVE
jgi:hypothetical protein